MNDNNLFTNRNSHSDFISKAITNFSNESHNIYAAVAFFTDIDTIKELTNKGCQLKLIVRLGFPTSPDALKHALQNDLVQIRYVTSPTFHPKLYIFGERGALVGSANLTNSALNVNQEVSVFIEKQDARFDQLMSLFYEYWSQSKVLNENVLEEYRNLYKKSDTSDPEKFSAEVEEALGRVRIQNIKSSERKKTKKEIFTEDYERKYQEFLSAFNSLENIYKDHQQRKVPEQKFPLRLEIDSFISWVRDHKARGESWKDTPVLNPEKRNHHISLLIKEWFSSEHSWLTENIVPYRYPLIKDTLKSKTSIYSCTDDELWETLNVCHSFYEQYRHVKGGKPAFKEEFLKNNDSTHVKDVVFYLVHGDENYITRMARCIYQPEYDVWKFGRAVIQELIAWVSKEELPVCNGRTTKIMRFFGYDIQQVNKM